MSPTESAATPTCPTCGSGMRQRRGARGDFLGCTRYPDCKGTRPLATSPSRAATDARAWPASPPSRAASAPPPPSEAPGPTGELIADLRKAAGHLGAAIDLLRRRVPSSTGS